MGGLHSTNLLQHMPVTSTNQQHSLHFQPTMLINTASSTYTSSSSHIPHQYQQQYSWSRNIFPQESAIPSVVPQTSINSESQPMNFQNILTMSNVPNTSAAVYTYPSTMQTARSSVIEQVILVVCRTSIDDFIPFM